MAALGLGGQGAFDQTKLWGKGQQAPLTPEYQKVLDPSMADQARRELGNYPPAHHSHGSFINKSSCSADRMRPALDPARI